MDSLERQFFLLIILNLWFNWLMMLDVINQQNGFQICVADFHLF